jgi:threonyl-tRNA synthetase
MIQVELPDGSTLDVEENSTVEDVAYEIGTGLGDDTVAGKINGELVSKEDEVSDGDEIEIVTEDSEEYVEVLRHSAAHVFAQALKRLRPEAKLTIGPWTDEGFYYDIEGVELEKEDLEEIEEEAQDIIEEDLEIERIKLSREEAEDFYSNNRFKQEILEEEASEEDEISFYEQGEFRDLCKGPHVSSTGEIGGFALLEIAGAYWRGDEDNEMLTRVYGTAFPSEEELEEFIEKRKEAEKRDHRKIGQEMDIFHITENTGPGLPLWDENGSIIYRQLQNYMHSVNRRTGHKEVKTPHLYKTDLWKESGHYENYQDDMFLMEVGDDEYGLKPMNCPGHATIFKQGNWSYRDMPVRYWEDGTVYRKEQKGELSGLLRVWGFTQDDGHLFCRPDQVKQEARQLLEKAIQILDNFGMEYKIDLATKNPDKYVGSDEIWEKAENQLEEVLEEADVEYGVDEEDAAFYGPKIDMKMIDALGREWDGPTVQLDFNMPQRFDLSYTTEDNEEETPVMIHRALYGSYERFIAVLTEHFAGDFPLWLAPEQVRILPVSDDNQEYAEKIQEELSDFRVQIEDRSWTVGKKIQAAHDDRVPYMVIVGDDEEEDGEISVRDRFENEDRGFTAEEFREHLEDEVKEKRLEPDFLQ